MLPLNIILEVKMTKHQLRINNLYLSANVGMTDSTLLKKKKKL